MATFILDKYSLDSTILSVRQAIGAPHSQQIHAISFCDALIMAFFSRIIDVHSDLCPWHIRRLSVILIAYY